MQVQTHAGVRIVAPSDTNFYYFLQRYALLYQNDYVDWRKSITFSLIPGSPPIYFEIERNQTWLTTLNVTKKSEVTHLTYQDVLIKLVDFLTQRLEIHDDGWQLVHGMLDEEMCKRTEFFKHYNTFAEIQNFSTEFNSIIFNDGIVIVHYSRIIFYPYMTEADYKANDDEIRNSPDPTMVGRQRTFEFPN